MCFKCQNPFNRCNCPGCLDSDHDEGACEKCTSPLEKKRHQEWEKWIIKNYNKPCTKRRMVATMRGRKRSREQELLDSYCDECKKTYILHKSTS